MRQTNYEYDAFISHAVEDKIPIANELCAKLEKAGLKIWYSGKELGVGDSIEKTIEKGLNRSRYGIVIFSPTYLAKNWTIREFYTLLAKEIQEHKVILPVLYNVTLDDLKNKDLVMADRFAVNSDRGLDFVVQKLVQEIQKSYVVKTRETWYAKLWLLLVVSLLANVGLLLKGDFFSGSEGQTLRQAPSLAANSNYDQAGMIHQSTFLEEMKGFFNQLNNCGCLNPQRRPDQNLYNASFSDDDAPFVKTSSGYNIPPANDPSANMFSSPGTKMTMAFVFQMENLGGPTSKESNQFFQSDSRDSEADAAATRVDFKNDLAQTAFHCVHPECPHHRH
jgi:hypothetical protein